MNVRVNRRLWWGAIALVVAGSLTYVTAQQPGTASGGVAIDPDDIGGVVRSAKGPEAGVWVIAETTDFPTRLIKSVVTDDQGRYVLPDLPKANYQVFARGYGLVDSQKVKGTPGQSLNLTAVVAPDGKAAAQYYPASSWLSLMEISKGAVSEVATLSTMKSCLQCHALGTPWTRTIPKEFANSASSLEAWDHRVKVGLSGANMFATFMSLGPQRQMFSDWTDKIAAGAYPTQAPPRPSGLERNVVITQWDWAWVTGTRADSVATNEENPRVNANGPVYGVYTTEGKLAWMNPRDNTRGEVALGASEADTPGLRSLAMDMQGRAWFTANLPKGVSKPAFCSAADNKFAKYFPLGGGSKQLVLYDPKTKKIEKIPTCVAVDHNHFGKEADLPLYFGANGVASWFSTATWDKTHDSAASQGWCPAVLDTNNDGKISAWTEPDQPVDPTKDHRIQLSCYSIAVSPTDGSLWCSGIDAKDDQLIRIERGANPPQSCKAEIFRPPSQKAPVFKSGGTSIDESGVAWVAFRGSDQVMSFDRRKCKTTNSTTGRGDQCPEGWTTQTMTRPTFKGTSSPAAAEMQYLSHIDRHDVLGLGANVLVTGTVNSDSMQLFVPKTGKFVDMVVPYPMGFFSRSSHGRIDDPAAGWKGRGLWSNSSTYTPHHAEGGRGTLPKAIKFQMRPDPLAK